MTDPDSATGTTDLFRMDSLAESLSIANQPDTMGPFRYWDEHTVQEKQRWRHLVEAGVFGWLDEHGLVIADANRVLTDAEIEAIATVVRYCMKHLVGDDIEDAADVLDALLARLAGAGEERS